VTKKGKREAIIRENNFQPFHTKSTQSRNINGTGMGAAQDVIVLQYHASQFFFNKQRFIKQGTLILRVL
jgi:hypothetical protein